MNAITLLSSFQKINNVIRVTFWQIIFVHGLVTIFGVVAIEVDEIWHKPPVKPTGQAQYPRLYTITQLPPLK